jgi:hypothetical protein
MHVLFVDESGSFANPDEPVCLAGLCCCEHDQPALRSAMKDLLAMAYLGAPYPPHAAVMHKLSSRAAMPETPYGNAAVELTDSLKGGLRVQWDKIRADWPRHIEPKPAALDPVDVHLQQRPTSLCRANSVLHTARIDDRVWTTVVLESLFADPSFVFPVVAAEAYAGSAGTALPKRYEAVCAALGALVRRIAPGPCHAWFGHLKGLPFGDQRNIISRSFDIRQNFVHIQGYDLNVHPGVALADMFAWRCWPFRKLAITPWSQLARTVMETDTSLEREGAALAVPVDVQGDRERWARWARDLT